MKLKSVLLVLVAGTVSIAPPSLASGLHSGVGATNSSSVPRGVIGGAREFIGIDSGAIAAEGDNSDDSSSAGDSDDDSPGEAETSSKPDESDSEETEVAGPSSEDKKVVEVDEDDQVELIEVDSDEEPADKKTKAEASGDEKSSTSTSKKKKKSTVKKEKAKKQTSKISRSKKKAAKENSAVNALQPLRDTGLDSRTLAMVNEGDWKGAAARLEKLAASDRPFGRDRAWLAFSYLFLNRCDDLAGMLDKANPPEEEDPDRGHFLAMKAFDEVCKTKLDEADKTMQSLPKRYVNDAFINFALAAIAGKRGKAGAAVEYCRRAVDDDPGFAWGYRTLGYLQLRWLNEVDAAEQSFENALAIEPHQNEVREMLINSYLSHNAFDEAVDVAEAGIKADRKGTSNHYRLAQIFIQQWRLREALAELEDAVKLEPENAVYWRAIASIQRHQKDYEDAIASQEKAVELSKDKTFELVELASLNALAGNNSEAVKNLEEALKLSPDSKAAHQQLVSLLREQKRFDDLLAEFKRAIAARPKESDLHMQYADTLHLLGSDEKAIEEYTSAANLKQDDSTPFIKIGAIYVYQKNYDKAVRAYRKALEINANSAQTLVALGYCYAQTDEYLKAEAAFVTALALQQLTGERPGDPKRPDIIRSLASLLVAEGRYSDAAAQFQTLYGMTAKSASADDDKFLLQQAVFLSSRTSGDADKLIAAYRKLGSEKGKSVRYMLVGTLLRADQPGKAVELIEEAKETNANLLSSEPRWMILRARAYRLSGDQEKAVKMIDQAIEKARDLSDEKSVLLAEALLEKARLKLSSDDLAGTTKSAEAALEAYDKLYSSYAVLGRVKLIQNDPDAAIELARKSLKSNPYFTDAYLLLGDSYLAKKEPDQAIDQYRKAAEIYPGLIEAQKSLLKALEAASEDVEASKLAKQITEMEKAHQ